MIVFFALGLLFLAHLFDAGTTIAALQLGGYHEHSAQIYTAWLLMGWSGIAMAKLAAAFATCGLLLYMATIPQYGKSVAVGLALIGAVYTAALAVNNLRLIA